MVRNRSGITAAAAGLLLLSRTASATAGACHVDSMPGSMEPVHSEYSFPIRTDARLNRLVDANGKPFFVHGDTAWSLIAQLAYEEAELYLRDRKARGFTTILVSLLEHRFASRAPANIAGEMPFLPDGDYVRPNEGYFRHADRVLKLACDLGFLVLLTPSYQGYGGGYEGWYGRMEEAGSEAMRSYGAWIGKRYGALDNIVWVHGGDHNPPDRMLVTAMVEGINEHDRNAVHTAHGAPGSSALDYWDGEPWLAFNTVYTYGSVKEAALEERKRSGALPFILIESKYENEHGAGAEQIRLQAYEALLAGASGHLYGNNPMWHFDGPGLFEVEIGWKEALDSPGARSMSIMQEIVHGLEWWTLEPDTEHRLGRGPTEISAAVAGDGSSGLIYLQRQEQLQLNLGALKGGPVEARWIDPTSGMSRAVQGSPFKAQHSTVRPPGRNSMGDGDWLLLLTTRREK